MDTERRRPATQPPSRRTRSLLRGSVAVVAAGGLITVFAAGSPSAAVSASFTRRVLAPVLPESPEELRMFPTAVKVSSSGQVIDTATKANAANEANAQP